MPISKGVFVKLNGGKVFGRHEVMDVAHTEDKTVALVRSGRTILYGQLTSGWHEVDPENVITAEDALKEFDCHYDMGRHMPADLDAMRARWEPKTFISDNERLDGRIPQYVSIGNVIKVFDWYGEIMDMAISPVRIMLLMYGPKHIWQHQTHEWDELCEQHGMMGPADKASALSSFTEYYNLTFAMLERMKDVRAQWENKMKEDQ